MTLNDGTLVKVRGLTPHSVAARTKVHPGDLKTGFSEGMGWGLGWGVVRKPAGVTEMLSPGAYGHGGAYGTQAWLDPKQDIFFVLLVQRSGFPNGDASDLRKALQSIAASAITD